MTTLVVNREDEIWSGTLDKGLWTATVYGTNRDYTGMLVVTRTADGKEIYAETVNLAYGAIFGPDVADVALWQDITIEQIDAFNAQGEGE